MAETVTIWVPTAKGVSRVDGYTPRYNGTAFRKPLSHECFTAHWEGRTWCRTEAQAREVAEQMRLKRIASLKKQLAKLEKIGPHSTPAGEVQS